jgi:nuclear RNA export factor
MVQLSAIFLFGKFVWFFICFLYGYITCFFFSSFFNAFDSQRHLLIDAYDPSATFSFSANTAIPSRARLEGFHSSRDMPNQRKLEWKTWLDGSRNLSRIGGDPLKTLENLHIGSEQVMKALTSLPRTGHDIGGPAEKFSLDSFPVPHGQSMGLLLTVHGQFTEGTCSKCWTVAFWLRAMISWYGGNKVV